MRVYLTGFMGAGKSEIGSRLAARLGTPFVDLDQIVAERSGLRVAEIFSRFGERGFRRLEGEALRATAGMPAAVVATGGGIVESADARRRLAELGTTVWLHPPFETLCRRIRASVEERPLFQDEEQARALWERRLPLYREVAQVTVEVADDEPSAETTERLVAALAAPAAVG